MREINRKSKKASKAKVTENTAASRGGAIAAIAFAALLQNAAIGNELPAVKIGTGIPSVGEGLNQAAPASDSSFKRAEDNSSVPSFNAGGTMASVIDNLASAPLNVTFNGMPTGFAANAGVAAIDNTTTDDTTTDDTTTDDTTGDSTEETTDPELTGITFSADEALNTSMQSKADAVPTLDHLKDNNPTIKGVTATYNYDDDTTKTYTYSNDYTVTTGSGYTYNESDTQEESSVTFWDVDKTTGEMTDTYYNVKLNTTEYGDTDGDTVKYYEPNSDFAAGFDHYSTGGQYKEVDTPTDGASTITVRYNSADTPAEGTYTSTYIYTNYNTDSEGNKSVDYIRTNTYTYKGNFVKTSADDTIEEIDGVYNNGGGIITGTYTSVCTNEDGTSYNDGKYDVSSGTAQAFKTIENYGTINKINADFIENDYGTVYNYGTIGSINSGFTSNDGIAVYNYGTIGDIAGYFINNDGATVNNYEQAGALFNGTGASITSITADFIGNNTIGYWAHGGAVFNYGTIGDIAGTFTSNLAYSDTNSTNCIDTYDSDGNVTATTYYDSEAYGGGIFNGWTIDNITGDFINNKAIATSTSADSYANGGAIYNYGNIGNITGDFIRNEAEGLTVITTETTDDSTSAASDDGTSLAITEGTTTTTVSGEAFGGAIQNSYDIGNITGDFVENMALGGEFTSGGAIYNYGDIGNITGDFTGNTSAVYEGDAYGGAVTNDNTIGHITGDFKKNAVTVMGDSGTGTASANYAAIPYADIYSSTGSAYGGAIANSYTITDITGDFAGNNASSDGKSEGGAIYNTGMIDKITGDFIGNTAANLEGSEANLYGTMLISPLTSLTAGSGSYSYLRLFGGAISNSVMAYTEDKPTAYYSGEIGDIAGDFIQNGLEGESDYTYGMGGAVYNYGSIDSITGNFTGNYISLVGACQNYSYGGAIDNVGTMGTITGDFSDNFVSSYVTSDGLYADSSGLGGAIYNIGTIDAIEGDFAGNSTEAVIEYVSSSSSSSGSSEAAAAGVLYAYDAYTYANGGAIYNHEGTINSINGNFSENSATASTSAGGYQASGYAYAQALGGAIYNDGTITNIEGDFEDNYTSASAINGAANIAYAGGGAVYNSGTIGTISGNFDDNYVEATTANGGAIYNNGTIGDIKGDFTNNSAQGINAYGGAIYNAGGDLTTVALKNFNSGYHVAIADVANTAQIGDISGKFDGNYAAATTTAGNAYGGAIANISSVDHEAVIANDSSHVLINSTIPVALITVEDGDGNELSAFYTSSNGYADAFKEAVENGEYIAPAGSLYSEMKILVLDDDVYDALTSDEKQAYEDKGYVYVLDKTNYNNYIGQDVEIGYGTNTKNGTFYYLQKSDALVDTDVTTGDALNHQTISLVNSDLTNNYAKSTSGTALGGAVYSNDNVNITADNAAVTIKDNYTESAGTKDYNAIYIGRDNFTSDTIKELPTVTMKAVNNGTIDMYDNINGAAEYGLALTGDGTGTINFTSTGTVTEEDGTTTVDHIANFNNANVTADNVTVNLNYNDGILSDYTPNSVTIDGTTATAALNLDVDLDNLKADTISTTVQSSGIVTVATINYLNSSYKEGEYKVQVLKTQTADLHLALADDLTSESILFATVDEEVRGVEADVNWQDAFGTYTVTKNYYGTLALATTDTTDDSIGVTITGVKENDTITDIEGDTLALWAEQDTPTDDNNDEVERNFNFDTAEDTYKVTDDLGTPTEGTLNINGKTETTTNDDGTTETTHSTIDLDGNEGFDITEDTTLNIKDTTLTGNDTLITVENSDAEVNLDNSTLDGDIETTDDVTYKMDITGDTTIKGEVGDADVTVEENATATFDYKDDSTDDHSMNSLNIDDTADTKLVLDIDGLNKTADTITVDETSSGTITIEEINWVNQKLTPDDTEYKIKVLNQTDDSSLELAISDELLGDTQTIIKTESVDSDTIAADVNWDEKFESYTTVTETTAEIGLTTTDKTNDSIGVTNIQTNTYVTDEQELDNTLTLWSTQETPTDDDGNEVERNFNFNSADDTYTVAVDLGNTTAGTLNINGVTDDDGNHSTIDLASHGGFTLEEVTTLNLNDTTLTGNDTLITVENSNAEVNLDNSTLDGDIAAATVYDLTASGDTTIKGDVENANVTVEENSTLNLDYVNDTVEDHSMNSINTESSTSDIKLALDIDGENKTADTITVNETSSGTVTINEINWINKELEPDSEYKIQILKQTDDSNVELSVDDGLLSDEERVIATEETEKSTVTPDIKWNDTVETYTEVTETKAQLGLATTEKTNDSIGVTVWDDVTKTNVQTSDNIIKDWAEQDTPTDENGNETERNFNFDTADDTYTAPDDLGNPTEGTLNINGVTDDDGNHSTIDLDGHEGFDITEETIVNFNNTTIKNGEPIAKVENENAQINVNNSTIDGDIESTVQYDMTIGGESKITGNVGTADVTVKDGTLTLTSNDHFSNSDVTFDGGNLNLINDNAQNLQAQSFTVNQNMKLDIDADLANVSMDRLPENTTVQNGAMINVDRINLVSDSKGETTVIPFAYDGFKDSVDYVGSSELSKATQVTTAFAPIYKYGVSYNRDDGMFTFLRGAGSSTNNSNAYNPAVLVSPVAAQTGGYMNMLDMYENSFMHMELNMQKPYSLRLGELNANKYALAENTTQEKAGFASNEMNSKGIWVKPYASYDTLRLKHGPKVNSFGYGSFIGGDTEVSDLGHGFYGLLSPFVSYQGSHQSFSGNSIYQNGGSLGLTGTLYKGNFFTGLTIGAGASVAEASTMYGHEDFPMFMAGVASRTGYNFEFKEGRYIIQPSLQLSYTFVNSFDYTNNAGVRISSDPLHALQINPNVRFIMNTKNGWSPYLTAGMNWNIMDETHFGANDVSLPQMSIKPYVQYGIGVQKTVKDRMTAQLQVVVRNGGRNGVAASCGFRWALGKEGKPIEKVEKGNGLMNASLPHQNRFFGGNINGKNWSASADNGNSFSGRSMGSAAPVFADK